MALDFCQGTINSWKGKRLPSGTGPELVGLQREQTGCRVGFSLFGSVAVRGYCPVKGVLWAVSLQGLVLYLCVQVHVGFHY